MQDSPKIDEERRRMSTIPYASGVGSIMYGMICSRPDLAYVVNVTHHDKETIKGYVDSDYAGNMDARKSIFGYVFTLYGTDVSWRAVTQSVVALSTTQVEFIALTKVSVEKIATEDNPADAFTKSLSQAKFKHCLDIVGFNKE
ncbi:secreted RxLR effector protein 161-like [Cicer arietinum]|uniref:secreted RxLR effector protein 161-like n=1 Tax=Cicer arietinum TaxID=3827 RepID=UPI003CC54DE1